MLGCCKHNYMPIWAASCGPRVNVLYRAFSAAAGTRGRMHVASCRRCHVGRQDLVINFLRAVVFPLIGDEP